MSSTTGTPATGAGTGTSLKSVRIMGLIVLIMGAVFAVAGITTYIVIGKTLADEHVTVSPDAKYFAGKDVKGPFTAYSEAQTIEKHAMEAAGGKTYAELARDDPNRQTVMTASFLRASLFTSVVAFGLAAFVAAVGVVLALVGWSMMKIGRASP